MHLGISVTTNSLSNYPCKKNNRPATTYNKYIIVIVKAKQVKSTNHITISFKAMVILVMVYDYVPYVMVITI